MLLDIFRREIEFENIHGYDVDDDIKDIVKRALDAEDNYNLLFIGPPASAKTLFLLGICDKRRLIQILVTNMGIAQYQCPTKDIQKAWCV